jgi:tetrathionate reductase subunit B
MPTNLRSGPTRRGLLAGRVAAMPLPRPAVGEAGPRWGMAIDLARCTGCEACTLTCAQENGTDPATPRMLVAIHEIARDGAPRIALLPRLCQHCATAPCIAACPVGASRRRRDGIVRVDAAACIGCGDCVRACPYDARALDARSGVADSCDFCAHRVDAGLLPACVEMCPGGALVFGDLNDPVSAANRRLASGPAQVLRPEAGTAPSVFYVGLATEG